jgi:hypothetical protein
LNVAGHYYPNPQTSHVIEQRRRRQAERESCSLQRWVGLKGRDKLRAKKTGARVA